jgi:threonine dehydrogenase-like Zn-dependent dehydrogenase
MRALVYHGPHDIGIEHRPDPEPGPDEVLLRITATGICGSDLHGYTGENKRRHPGQVMGHETVGRIVAVGSAVSDEGLTPGRVATVNPVIGCGECAQCAAGTEQLCPRRKVIGVDREISSAFAELMLAPAHNVVVLPDDLPEEYGALIEPLAVGYHAARNGRLGSGDAVLVIGGGPIGQAAALAARRLDAGPIVVSEPSRARRELVEKLGFATIDPTAGELPEQVHAALGGPATAVLDAVGTGRTVGDGLRSSAPGAGLVLVGMGARELTLAAFDVSTFERSIIGSFTYPSREFRETAEWVASRPDGLQHLVDDRVGLDGAAEAFARLASGDLDASKIIVLPSGMPAERGKGER